MRTFTFATLACLAACSSGPALSTGSLVGTWNGTMSNGVMTRFNFRSDRSFDSGRVDIDGTYAPAETGTYDVAGEQVKVDMTLTGDPTLRFTLAVDSHLGAGGLCLGAYSSPNAADTVGTWTLHATLQQLDTSGMPMGAAQDATEMYVIAADGTYMHSGSQVGDSGTWQRTGDQLTFTQSGPGGGVLVLTLVDGEVLCNPVLKKS
jgi:hypothetical protein